MHHERLYRRSQRASVRGLLDYHLGHLIRIDRDGSAKIVDEGIHLANGLGFALDLRTLYFADSVARAQCFGGCVVRYEPDGKIERTCPCRPSRLR